jgi:tetratricopeptide (TPR) repeat protein
MPMMPLRLPLAPTVLALAACQLFVTPVAGFAQANSAAPSSVPQEELKQVEIDLSGDKLAEEAFKVNDADPESSVPTMEQAMRSPLKMGYFVMLLIERGKAAQEHKEFPAAIRYRRALVKAVPERSIGYSLLCQTHEAAGDLPAATKACRDALGKAGVTVEDNLRFVNLVLAKQGDLATSEIEDVQAIIAHLDKELTSDDKPIVIERMRCDLATRVADEKGLEACTQRLGELQPNDPRTFAYSWALALRKRDFDTATALIASAKAAGLPEPAIAKMQAGLQAERDRAEPVRRWLDQWGLLVGLTLSLLSLAALLSQRKRAPLAESVSHG